MQKHKVLLAIGYEREEDYAQACALAEDLDLPVNNQADNQLLITSHGLVLKFGTFTPLSADFNIQTWQKRRDEGKKQAIIRACKPVPGMKILDATAGWGRDSAILASYGAEVTMLERNPVMAALLKDALNRQDERSQQVLRLHLKQMDALSYLQNLPLQDYPDLIFIDPMHPSRQKSALVKKDLQILQQMIGSDDDAKDLLILARSRAKGKVVMKWPQQLPPLEQPAFSMDGKTVRFDIYRGSALTGDRS